MATQEAHRATPDQTSATAGKSDQLVRDEASACTRQMTAALLLLWFCAGLAVWRASASFPEPPAASTILTTIDPNTAPWWELSLLPEIGDSLAREIVRYREEALAKAAESAGADSAALAVPAAPVFTRAADLDAIRGIGPKTIQRLAPYLRFPQSPSASAE